MRVRWLAAWSCLIAAMAFGVAACGDDDSGGGGGSKASGKTLTIYSSLPLQGDSPPAVRGRRPWRAAGAGEGRRQGRQFQDQVHIARRLRRVDGQVGSRQGVGERPQGGRRRQRDRLPGRVQLGRVRDLDAAAQRGGHPAGLAREHLRGPDAIRGRGEGRAAEVPAVRHQDLRPCRARGPHPGGGAGFLDEGRGGHQALHPQRQGGLRQGHRRRGREDRQGAGHRRPGQRGHRHQGGELPLPGGEDQERRRRRLLLRRGHPEQGRPGVQGRQRVQSGHQAVRP